MATLKADRRLYVSADRSVLVEHGDPRGAFLLAGIDGQLGEGDVRRFHLTKRDGKVRYPGDPFELAEKQAREAQKAVEAAAAEAAEAEAKAAAKPEDKAVKAKPNKSAADDGQNDDAADDQDAGDS